MARRYRCSECDRPVVRREGDVCEDCVREAAKRD